MSTASRSAPSRSRPLILVAALVLAVVAGPSLAARRSGPVPAPPQTQISDPARHVDVNRVNMYTTNFGTFAHDVVTGNAGLVWPKGTDRRAVFSSGLWLGCRVNGQLRVAVAEYSSEYGPGAMNNGTFDDPSRPEYQVYKVSGWSGNPADTTHRDRTPGEMAADPLLDPLDHHSWSEYMAGAAPYGAPARLYRLPDTSTPDPTDSVDVFGPDMLGDRMLWELHNDADPALHFNGSGQTLPLGVEIQQTTFAIDRADGLGDIVFIRFQIWNKGGNTLDSLYVSLWSDPDVGGFTDDLVGCDIGRALGFAYNATNSDAVYGSQPPSVGYVLLQGPLDPSNGVPLPMTAFSKYINGTDPQSSNESYNYMQGLLRDGSVVIDPTTGLPTRFFHPGDPVSGLGWLDSIPADRRFLVSSGPGRLLPGESQDVWAAVVVGGGEDRLASVAVMRCLADVARDLFHRGFVPPPGLLPPCPNALVNCPRPRPFWALECQAGGSGLLSPQQLNSVAQFVHAQSTLFDWPFDPLGLFCATVNAPGFPDLREEARGEFATFLANYSSNQVDLSLGGGQRIFLNPDTEVSCPPLRARTIAELAAPASLAVGFVDGIYLDHVADHPIPLVGVNAGLAGFGGGADVAWNFFGSPLDPVAHSDSFVTVEVRFDHAATQKAYRYLRLERQSDSGPPPQGRGYLYGGHLTVPFTCWDVEHNVQLDVGFVERTFTDDSGIILDQAFQPSTHDSTWAPDSSDIGGREYLFAFIRPYSDSPKAELAQDGIILEGTAPALYALWSRRRSGADVIDDGDAFRFVWGTPPSPGADSLLVALQGQPAGDPAVQQAYQHLIDCLSAINQGIGIGPTCPSGPTPTLVSLVSAEALVDRVSLRWYADGPGLVATVERRAEGEDWAEIGRVTADGEHYLMFEDRAVSPGRRYDYRLAVASGGSVEYMGEVRVEVPSTAVLAFRGAWARAGDGRLMLSFSLASREPARIEVLDIAGRRMFARDVAGPTPGSHTLELGEGARLASGIYLVRILQGGQRVIGKAAVVR